jgi:hypothetical protein
MPSGGLGSLERLALCPAVKANADLWITELAAAAVAEASQL